jgi:hypothetical protein
MQSKIGGNRRRKKIAREGHRPPFKGKRDHPQYVGAYVHPTGGCCINTEPLANDADLIGSEIDIDLSRTSRKLIGANLPATRNEGTRIKAVSRIIRICVRNRSVHGEGVSSGSCEQCLGSCVIRCARGT